MIISGSGYSAICIGRSLIVALYFNRFRSLAMGISLLGMAFGSVASPMITRTLLDYYGWRGALTILAAINLQTLPFVCLLKPPPDPLRHKNTQATTEDKTFQHFWKELQDFSLLRRLDVKLYCFSSMMFTIGFYTYTHHLPSRIVSKGLSLRTASLIPTYMAISIIIVRLGVSIMSNLKSCESVVIHTTTILVGGLAMVAISLSDSVAYMISNAVAFGGVIGKSLGVFVIIIQ